MINVTVVIPVHNDYYAIQQTLKSLKSQISEYSFEVVIVDNGSTDGTYEWLREQDGIILLQENIFKGSPYSARNRGIEKANGEIIALLDSTCVPKTDFIQKGIKYFNKNRRCDMFGGNIIFDLQNNITAGKIYDSITNVQMGLSIELKNATKTANLWVKMEVFDKYGLFNEGVRSGEDLNWTKKMTGLGVKLLYNPLCIASKYARGTKQLLKKQYRVGKGKAFIWRNEKILSKMLLKSFRKIFPITPRGLKTILSRNSSYKITLFMKTKIYFVSYFSGLSTLFGIIVGSLRREKIDG